MTLSFLQTFLDWLGQHVYWSALIIFTIACTESLTLVGLLVPGAVLMFALGTLIATGHLAFWPTVGWAALGAVAGDGISYWLGYYYQDRLAKLWPLSQHPQLLEKGRLYFDKHGGKSILFGRFIGPLRPIVPAIAGMSGMALPRFFAINILSGIAWAPLYLLPGMAFGLSLSIAAEVAGRLVAAILLLITLILIMLWLGKRLYHALLPRIDKMLFTITLWSRQHPVAGQIPAALIRPDHPEVRILSLLALLLFLASSTLLALAQLTAETSLLRQLDKLLQVNLELLRTPWFDQLMLGISAWAETANILLLTFFCAVWLLWQRNLLALWHLLAALLLTSLLSYGLPMMFTAAELSLPSTQLMLMTAVAGFMAVVLAREISLTRHLLVYLLAASLIFLSGFARLYLQFDTLSESLGGITLGSIWLAILGIAYRRHVHQAYVSRPALISMGAGLAAYLLLTSAWLTDKTIIHQADSPVTMTAAAWHKADWRKLATIRNDIRYQHTHPLNLQWAGDLHTIQRQLENLGWQRPISAQSLHFLQWFNPKPDIQALPLLPQVHDGHYDVLRMIKFGQHAPRFIRLWQTNIRIQHADTRKSLWLGSVGRLYRQQLLGLSLFRTSHNYALAARQLRAELMHTQPPLTIKAESAGINGQSMQILLLKNK